jgi:hypothetical protein
MKVTNNKYIQLITTLKLQASKVCKSNGYLLQLVVVMEVERWGSLQCFTTGPTCKRVDLFGCVSPKRMSLLGFPCVVQG